MKEQYSPNIPHPLEYSPNGIGVVDGIGYINMLFTQGSKIPEDVKIELEGITVDGTYNKETGHYLGDFLPSYGSDKIYNIKGKAIAGNGVEAVIDYTQAFNTIDGMSVEVTDIRVCEKSILHASLKLNIDSNIRLPNRVYPSLIATFTKGVDKKVSVVSWDAKTNTGVVGYKLCDVCTDESMRVIESNIEVDNKLISFSIKYLTPAVTTVKKTQVLVDGVIHLTYSLVNENNQIPKQVSVTNVKLTETRAYPVLIGDVKSSYNQSTGLLSFSVPVGTPTEFLLHHHVTGSFVIDNGTIVRTFDVEDVSYIKHKELRTLVKSHTIDGNKETLEVINYFAGATTPVTVKYGKLKEIEAVKRKLVSMRYNRTTGVTTLVWDVEYDKDVPVVFELDGTLEFPDYGDLTSEYKSAKIPTYYLLPPTVKRGKSILVNKNNRLWVYTEFDLRFRDGSIPRKVEFGSKFRDHTQGSVLTTEKADISYDMATGKGVVHFPILPISMVDGPVGYVIDVTFPEYTTDWYSFRFKDVLPMPLVPSWYDQKLVVTDGYLYMTQYIIDQHGDAPYNVWLKTPFEISKGIDPDAPIDYNYHIADGLLEIKLKVLDPKTPLVDYKIKSTLTILGYSGEVVINN